MMREMSADVQQSGVVVAAAAVGAPAPAVVAAPVAVPAASENVAAPAVVATGRGVGPLAVGGYLLLAVGTALAIGLPRVGMKAGWFEDTLVILSILSMIAGAAMVMLSFVRNLLRQL